MFIGWQSQQGKKSEKLKMFDLKIWAYNHE